MTYLKKFGCKTTIASSRYWRTTQKEIPWEKVKNTIRINTSKMHFLFVFVLFWMLLLKASVVSPALNKKRLHQNMQVLIFNKNASSL